jgi:enoyl-CoA hydratase/carnithine racemase
MLGFPESESGLMPGFGGTVRGADIAARSTLVRMMLSGEMVRGDDAAGLGLVDRSVPLRALAREAQRFVDVLTARRPSSLIRSVMAAIHNAYRLPHEQALAEETRLFCKVGRQHLLEGSA